MSKLINLLRKLGGDDYNPQKKHITAIILAGGVGSRMGNEDGVTKQMMELDGMPLIARTVAVFEESKVVSDIVLVVRKEEMAQYDEMKEAYGWKKIVRIVIGGQTRQESAIEGFKAIDDKTEIVLIHDGARCLLTEQIIESVARGAMVHGGAIAAERASATVKKADAQGMIEETLDRNTVWFAQTPQGFKTETYRAAVYLTLSKGNITATDDAMFLENVDLPVKVIDCGDENIKITTKRDLYVAKAILAQRGEKRRAEEAKSAEQRQEDRKKRREAGKI